MAQPTAGRVVVLSLASTFNGRTHQYATPAQAQAAVDVFGYAEHVERGTQEWRVTCPTARGQAGAYRLHSLACGYGIPVHIL